MKKPFLFLILFFISLSTIAQISLIEATANTESVTAKWTPDTTQLSYSVYLSGEGIINQKADNSLIRNYGTYLRVDIPGLKAGTYQVKIVPLYMKPDSSIYENTDLSIESGNLTVTSHDRTGYGFWDNRIPGAYKSDGTLKDNAVVIYVSNWNKNTISLDVTGATTNPCVGLQTILDGFKKGKDNRPLCIRIIGQITDLDYMLGGDLVIENSNNASSYITMEGIGDDATLDGFGLRIKNASNIEVLNLGFMNTDSDEGDNLGLQQNNDHIWVHNCDLFYGNAGSDADQAKGDGALDVKKSTYITLSYNHFWDTGKSNLLGLSEGSTTGLFISYHHNWYDHSDSRHPRVRYYSAHVYNNYYDGIANYGVGSTLGSSVFVEANYFRNCKYPMLTSMQGSDVWNETTQTNDYKNMPTFSSEDGGTIKSFNNFMTGQRRFVPFASTSFTNSSIDFDAYVALSREEQVPSTVKSVYGGNTYNNFDTNSSLIYTYTPDSPEEARNKVIAQAGRVQGGDFKWTFNNATDDASTAINTALKSALINYKTSLINIQGELADTTNTGSGETGGENGGGTITDADYIQNFTTSGKASNFYSITGNLSTSYGNIEYNSLSLTQCLKMESSTLISFTSTQSGTINLIFNPAYSGTIKIDGETYTPVSGVLKANLNAGSHTIQKGSGSSYLFYMFLTTFTNLENNRHSTNFVKFNPLDRTLSCSQDVNKIEIYDLNGRLLESHKINGSTKIESKAGIYLIKGSTSTHTLISKIQID